MDSEVSIPRVSEPVSTHATIIRWLGAALTLSLLGVVAITLSALWKPPQDWSVVDKGISYLNTMVLALSGGLLALARPSGGA